MQIVDLRPASQRWLDALWRRASNDGQGALARFGSVLADRIAAERVRRRGDPERGTLVVSVGNLRVGGTGKTPVVARLAGDLAAAGVRGCILTRGYGSDAPGPLLVAPEDAEAGDEARLLAAAVVATDWVVVQARRRTAGLGFALTRSPRPEVVLLDDGHQTASLGRHCDVLILDRWEEIRHDGHAVGLAPRTGPVLPWGPYRESARGAERADVWLVESPQPPEARGAKPAICGFAREATLSAAELPPGPVGLLSGLGRPEGFEAMCTRALGRMPKIAVRCADHCRYGDRLLGRILAEGERAGVAGWVTTEKDWVKLRGSWPAAVPLAVARLTVAWTGTPTLPEVILAERRRRNG